MINETTKISQIPLDSLIDIKTKNKIEQLLSEKCKVQLDKKYLNDVNYEVELFDMLVRSFENINDLFELKIKIYQSLDLHCVKLIQDLNKLYTNKDDMFQKPEFSIDLLLASARIRFNLATCICNSSVEKSRKTIIETKEYKNLISKHISAEKFNALKASLKINDILKDMQDLAYKHLHEVIIGVSRSIETYEEIYLNEIRDIINYLVEMISHLIKYCSILTLNEIRKNNSENKPFFDVKLKTSRLFVTYYIYKHFKINRAITVLLNDIASLKDTASFLAKSKTDNEILLQINTTINNLEEQHKVLNDEYNAAYRVGVNLYQLPTKMLEADDVINEMNSIIIGSSNCLYQLSNMIDWQSNQMLEYFIRLSSPLFDKIGKGDEFRNELIKIKTALFPIYRTDFDFRIHISKYLGSRYFTEHNIDILHLIEDNLISDSFERSDQLLHSYEHHFYNLALNSYMKMLKMNQEDLKLKSESLMDVSVKIIKNDMTKEEYLKILNEMGEEEGFILIEKPSNPDNNTKH